MSIKKSDFKTKNGNSWDEHHFKTDSGQVLHTTEDGEQTTVEEELNRQNRNYNKKFPGSWHIDNFRITLSYDNGNLRGYHYFNGSVISAVATVEYTSGTPHKQVDELWVQRALGGAGNRIDVFARGQFVSGHVLNVNVIAIVQDS